MPLLYSSLAEPATKPLRIASALGKQLQMRASNGSCLFGDVGFAGIIVVRCYCRHSRRDRDIGIAREILRQTWVFIANEITLDRSSHACVGTVLFDDVRRGIV